MYIVCDNSKRIINTECAACIGYEKRGTAYNPHYRVFAYSGNAIDENSEIKYVISTHPMEAQAQFIVSYIAEMLESGANTITI